MFKRTVSEDELARLKREREEADQKYNEALTQLDRALARPPELPHAPPAFDDSKISPLNKHWQIIPDDGPSLGGGWRARIASIAWTFIGPILQNQERFNAVLVDHINRNVPHAEETQKATSSIITLVNSHIDEVVAFQSQLIQFVQQLTPFIDTKLYESSTLGRRINEDVASLTDTLEQRTRGMVGAIDGVSDEIRKRWETTLIREQRFVQHVDELRISIGHLQHGIQTIRREIERLATNAKTLDHASPSISQATLDDALDEFTYVGFENLFRGATEEIRSRLTEYLPYFEGATDVLDLGCGRGEFLDLLRESGVRARGLDINAEMIEECHARALTADVGDALTFLQQQDDRSLGGLFAAQVVEHLEPHYLVRLLAVASQKLRPGSKIILETINPACWFAFFDAYIRDITHVRPLHPDTLKYLLTANGFQQTTVRYSAAFPEDSKLQHVALDAESMTQLHNAVTTLNNNIDKLNDLMFTHLDYAVIGERL